VGVLIRNDRRSLIEYISSSEKRGVKESNTSCDLFFPSVLGGKTEGGEQAGIHIQVR